MDSTGWMAVSALAAMTCLPLGTGAQERDDTRLRALEQRLQALEDKLEASQATIEAQQALLRQRAPAASDGGDGAEAFFRDLEVGGHVTGSYLYNFNRPDRATGSPASGASVVPTQTHTQFHQNHDTFSLDAVKLEIGKPTRGPGTVGFQVDVLLGENRRLLTGERSLSDDDGELGVYLQEAYAVYNWRGVDLLFGKFETLLGAELIDSPYNHNVTQGLLFFGAIPLVHTGILASGSLSEEIGWALGVTNGFNNFRDFNGNKGVLGQLSFSRGPLFTSLQAYFGADGGDTNAIGSTDDQLIVDLVGTYQLTDRTQMWLNLDYGEQRNDATLGGSDAQWLGAALGTRFDWSEKTYLALRGEWFDDRDGTRFGAVAGEGVDLYSLTATIGRHFADRLMTRAELRFDRARGDLSSDRIFAGGNGRLEDDAVLGIVEVSYTFD